MKKLIVCLLFFAGCASGPNPYSVVDPSDPWHTKSFPLAGQPLMRQSQSVNVNVFNNITCPNGGGGASKKVKREFFRNGQKIGEE